MHPRTSTGIRHDYSENRCLEREALPPPHFGCKSMPGVHEKVLDLAESFLDKSDILVMGSGQGSFEHRLLTKGIPASRITSVDIDPGQYKLNGLACHFCDLNQKAPFAENSFDVVIAIEVIEHLYNPHNLINEAFRVLKPHGRLFVTTPNVHSFPQKLRYLFSDQFLGFHEKQYLGSGHIHPIFHWLLERMIGGKFHIDSYDSNRFQLKFVPFLPGIRLPFRHRFFAAINIYGLRSFKSREKS